MLKLGHFGVISMLAILLTPVHALAAGGKEEKRALDSRIYEERDRLDKNVAELRAIVKAQANLKRLYTEESRHDRLSGETLPWSLCIQSVLRPICADLEATFGQEGSQ